MHLSKFLVALAALSCFVSAPRISAQKLAPLPIDEVTKARQNTPVPAALSPDGEWLAYTTRDQMGFVPLKDETKYFGPTGVPDSFGSGHLEVWITNTKTRESVNLAGARGSSWGPVWSRDGKRLAFYSDRSGESALWLWEKSTRQARRLSDAIVHPFFWFEDVRWTPDGKSILCKILPEGMTLAQAAGLIPVAGPRIVMKDSNEASVRVYTSPSQPAAESAKNSDQPELTKSSFTNVELGDLAFIDADSGKLKRIVHRADPAWYSISPDGARVAFTNQKWVEANSQQNVFDLQVYSIADGRLQTVVPRIRLSYGLNVSWSPNGKFLSYTTAGPRADGECYLVPASGGESRKCANGAHPSFNEPFRAPLWDTGGENLYFLSGGSVWGIRVSTGAATEVAKIPGRTIREVVAPMGGGRFTSPDSGRSMIVLVKESTSPQSGFYRVDLQTGQSTKLLEDNRSYGGHFAMYGMDTSVDGKQFAFVAEDARHADDLWITDADFHNARRITAVAPVFDQYELGDSRLIDWTTADGQKLQGSLLLPAGYKEGTRYPMVVFVYGGDMGSRFVNRFGMWAGGSQFNMQIFATRGYAVLFPDTPLRKGTPLKDLAATVLPGVDRAIELGIADPDRLAVMGQSYGSYCTLALIVQTTRFKAALVSANVAAILFEGYLYMTNDGIDSTGYYEEGQGGMGGNPWQYPERYAENSPIFRFDKIETPILMIQGAEDSLPLEWPDHTFVALRRLGKQIEYALYGGEGHVIQGVGNSIDVWNRRLALLDRQLKGKPGPASSSGSTPGAAR
ncbi:MAG: prolyl oligopeptidase family serine peptidase [Candidatus Acidiferrales bacterium]